MITSTASQLKRLSKEYSYYITLAATYNRVLKEKISYLHLQIRAEANQYSAIANMNDTDVAIHARCILEAMKLAAVDKAGLAAEAIRAVVKDRFPEKSTQDKILARYLPEKPIF